MEAAAVAVPARRGVLAAVTGAGAFSPAVSSERSSAPTPDRASDSASAVQNELGQHGASLLLLETRCLAEVGSQRAAARVFVPCGGTVESVRRSPSSRSTVGS